MAERGIGKGDGYGKPKVSLGKDAGSETRLSARKLLPRKCVCKAERGSQQSCGSNCVPKSGVSERGILLTGDCRTAHSFSQNPPGFQLRSVKFYRGALLEKNF